MGNLDADGRQCYSWENSYHAILFKNEKRQKLKGVERERGDAADEGEKSVVFF